MTQPSFAALLALLMMMLCWSSCWAIRTPRIRGDRRELQKNSKKKEDGAHFALEEDMPAGTNKKQKNKSNKGSFDESYDSDEDEEGLESVWSAIAEETPCEPVYQEAIFYYNRIGHPEKGSVACYEDPVNGCPGGCCRIASAYFICDATGGDSPTMPCVCNDLTDNQGAFDAIETLAPDDEEEEEELAAEEEEVPEIVVTASPTLDATQVESMDSSSTTQAASAAESTVEPTTAYPTDDATQEPTQAATAAESTVEPVVVASPPPTLAPVSSPFSNLVETAASAGRFTNLLAIWEKTGITELLQGYHQPYTIFAPNDMAWPQGNTLSFFLNYATNEMLLDIVTYQIVEGLISPLHLTNGTVLSTLQGKDLIVTVDDDSGVTMVGGVPLLVAPLLTSNGVIYEMQDLLFP